MWNLIKRDWPLILFGLLFSFGSSFGQTFFVSIFVEPISFDFGISTTQFSQYYALLTIVSGFMIPFIGSRLDRVDLLKYSACICIMLSLGIATLSLSSHLWLMVLALLVVRMSGQGLMTHVGLTAISRYFDKNRGKALSLINMGYPLGEGLLPMTMVTLIALIGWRLSYALGSLVVLGIILPLSFYLVRKNSEFRMPSAKNITPEIEVTPAHLGFEIEHQKFKKRQKRMKLLALLLVIPSYTAGPMFLTALIFHQSTLSKFLKIDFAHFAKAFVLFAVSQVCLTFVGGALVDRFTARRVYALHVIPMSLGILALVYFPSIWGVAAFFFLIGMTPGLGKTFKSAVIAELVPVNRIASVKSVSASLMIFSTALGPVLYSYLFDMGVSLNAVLWGTSIYGLISVVIAYVGISPRLVENN